MNSKLLITALAIGIVIAGAVGFYTGRQKGLATGEVAGTQRAEIVEKERARLATEQQLVRTRLDEETKKLAVAQADLARLQEDQQRARDDARKAELARLDAAATAAVEEARRLAAAVSPYGVVKVLVIGINYTGHASLSPLAFAESDAAGMADLLGKTYRFQPTRLLGADATRNRILDTARSLLASLGPNDDFLLYFSGHGSTLVENQTQRTGLILPIDAAPASADKATQRARAIEITALVAMMKASPGRHRIAVLDSCFSGLPAIPGVSVQAGTAPANPGNPLRHRSVQLISAGAANERALELPTVGGIFSHEIRRALVASDTSPQSLLRLFITVKEAVTHSDKYVAVADGRPASPQHRSFEATPGDFIFIPPPAYPAWARSHEVGTAVEGYVLQPVSETELRSFLAKLSPPKPEPTSPLHALAQHALPSSLPADAATAPASASAAPTLPDEQLRRYEARASLGDPRALAILSALGSRSTEPARRRVAAEYAFTAFETGADSGKAALGLAYAEGFGVTRDVQLGAQLLQVSGYADAIPWLKDIAAVVAAADVLKKKDDPVAIVSAAVAAAGGIKSLWGKLTNALRRNPVDTLSANLQTVRKQLTPATPDFATARRELAAAQKALESSRDLTEESRKPLVAVVAALDQSCERRDAPEALKLIDLWLAGVEQQKK